MAASDFSWTPKEVSLIKEEPNLYSSQMESFRVHIQQLDANVLRVFELDFGEILESISGAATFNTRANIHAHFRARNGAYESFSWTNPPSWISGTAITVRYYTGNGTGYEETPSVKGRVFAVKVQFLEVI